MEKKAVLIGRINRYVIVERTSGNTFGYMILDASDYTVLEDGTYAVDPENNDIDYVMQKTIEELMGVFNARFDVIKSKAVAAIA